MGMFDYIRVLYPLPIGGMDIEFQTKDTHIQGCVQYELREDGTLWHLAVDGVNWEQEALNGSLNFYDTIGRDGWLEYEATMQDGILQGLRIVEHKVPTE